MLKKIKADTQKTEIKSLPILSFLELCNLDAPDKIYIIGSQVQNCIFKLVPTIIHIYEQH